MTQKDKELLFKDLCARLPYKLVIHADDTDIKLDRNHRGLGVLYYEHYNEDAKKRCGYDKTDFSIIISGCFYGHNIKPYLFPFSSMTEEQRKEYEITTIKDGILTVWTTETYDWLNENHFDYRGLIPKGLAIDATGLNIY